MTLNESPIDRTSLSPEMMRLMQAWWRAANFLSVGQIYLLDNPLLDEPLKPEHIKPRLLGHWGTTPGLNFIYVHLNRIIKEQDVNVLFIAGPGHGAPGIVANTWLERIPIRQNHILRCGSNLDIRWEESHRGRCRCLPKGRRRFGGPFSVTCF